MKRYYKEENGTKIWLDDVLKVDGKVIINPTEEQILAAGYVEYIANNVHGLTEEQVLENLKRGKVLQLHDFDNSKEVNVCYIVYKGNFFAVMHRPLLPFAVILLYNEENCRNEKRYERVLRRRI